MLNDRDLKGRISGGLLPRLAFCLGLLPLAQAPAAWAQTGIRLLDQPAIAVKAPDRVVLIAVATAGSRIVAVGEHGVIAYSDDNGQSWHQGSVPVDVTLTAVAFATPQQGWAVGHDGVILHTTDGGATWQEQLNGIQANQLITTAAQAAVAGNDPSLGTAHALARAAHFNEEGPVNPFLSIWVQDPNDAIVFGAYRLAMKTTDGGKTWVDWSLHIGDTLSHNIYDVAPVGQNLYLVGETGLVFESTDGGNSFPAGTSPGANSLFEALPTGDGGVFACGVAGAAFRSEDSGKSWQSVNFGTSDNLAAGVVLQSGVLVVGSESGILYVSRDHAQSFTALPQPQPLAIYGLAQAANGDVVEVGSGGAVVVPAADFKS